MSDITPAGGPPQVPTEAPILAPPLRESVEVPQGEHEPDTSGGVQPVATTDAPPAESSDASDIPGTDPHAFPVIDANPATAPLVPTVEAHEPTDSTLLHYTADGLDAPTVTRLADGAGYQVIGAPDHIDGDHWRVQVRTPDPKE